VARAFLRSIRGKKRKALFANLPSDASKEIRQVVNRKVKPALVKAHEMVVADWESDVSFKSKVVITPDAIKIYVYPAGADKRVWTFVDKGTKPHKITPKGPGYPLRFNWGGKGSYKPKTLPRPARTVIGGGVQTGPEVRAMVVKHPGTEARNFTKQIAKEMGPEIRAEIERAFRRVARRTYE
jgi:hypothetical protein